MTPHNNSSVMVTNEGGGGGEEEEYVDYLTPDYNSLGWEILDCLHVYYVPSISVVGIVGNILSMVVFLCTHLRSRSSSYYLAALAAADITFLAQLLIVSLSYVGIDVYNRTFGCRMLVYLSSVATFLSVWLVVGFTVERFIAIQYPLQRPNMCTVQRAKLTILGLVIFSLVSYSYIWFSADIVEESDGQFVCDIYPELRNVFYVINIVDTVATLFLPVTLILVMNTMIAVQLFRFSRIYCNDTATVVAPTVPTVPVADPRPCSLPSNSLEPRVTNAIPVGMVRNLGVPRGSSSRLCSSPSCSLNKRHFGANQRQQQMNVSCVYYNYGPSTSTVGSSGGGRGGGGGGTLSHRAQYNITKMLFVISTVFLCLNLPSYVMRLHNFYSTKVSGSVLLIQQYTMILFYTNFSINFLLYSTYGVAFRRALYEFLRRTLQWKSKRKSPHCGLAMEASHSLKRKQFY